MKQDRTDRLIEITGMIPEAYVAEAMPQSLRETLPSDGITETPEEKTMKTSIAHYIAGGFAAAAAIGVLVGGGLLISTLNRKPERPGDSGSETTVTSLTETTETTTATDESYDIIENGDFRIAKYADHAELIRFNRDSDAESVEIPAEADGLPVTVIRADAFSGCSKLKSAVIPDSVKYIGDGAFAECIGLTDISIPNSVTGISTYLFSGCRNLTNIVIPYRVTNIGKGAFSHCSALTGITIPDSVEMIGEQAFSYCGGLIHITMPGCMTSIGTEAFAYCTNLEAVTFLNDDVQIAERAFMGCDENRLALRGGARIEEYARANGLDYEPLDGTQSNTDRELRYKDMYDRDHYYTFHNGELSDVGELTGPLDINDDKYCYYTKENSLYRRNDNKKMFTLEAPRQYLKEAPADADISVEYGFILDIGGGWFYTSISINADECYADLNVFFNDKTGAVNMISDSEIFPVIESKLGEKIDSHSGLFLTSADPDGGAVYSVISGYCVKDNQSFEAVVRIPCDDPRNLSVYLIDYCGLYGDDMARFAPLKGRKIFWYEYTPDDRAITYELDLETGEKALIPDVGWWNYLVYRNGRYICFDGEDLMEYLPDSKSVRIIANVRKYLGEYGGVGIACIFGDSVLLDPVWDGDWLDGVPQLLVSLKDGKVTKLPV